MAIYKGEKEVVRIYKGSKPLDAIYKGGQLIWRAQEAWVEYADGVLTFHYDSQKKQCTSTAYSLNTGNTKPSWSENAANITKVVFDEAFSKARPTTCANWFQNMKVLTDIEGIEYLNTSQSTNMVSMFEQCNKITNLDLRTFDTSNVKNMQSLFSYTYSLQSLDVSNWNTEKVTGMSYLFFGSGLKSVDLSSWRAMNLGDWQAYIFQSSKLEEIKMFTIGGLQYMASFFGSCPIERVDESLIGTIDTSNVYYMGVIFAWNSKIKYADLSCWDTSRLTSIDRCFYYCTNIETAILPKVKKQGQLNAGGITQLWEGCAKLKSADLSVFAEGATDKITSITRLCYNCQTLPEIDLTYISTQKVTNTKETFYNCQSLEHIYVDNNFTMDAVTESTNMFYGCTKLPNFDATKVDASMAKLDTEGGYLTFRANFKIGDNTYYIYDKSMVYEGDLVFNAEQTYESRNEFTLGANNTAVYNKSAEAGNPEAIILPFSINTDDYSNVTFYDMDGNELSGETIDAGTEFGIEVSTSKTIVFTSEKGATIIKSSLVNPTTISTMDLTDEEEIVYPLPEIEMPEDWDEYVEEKS